MITLTIHDTEDNTVTIFEVPDEAGILPHRDIHELRHALRGFKVATVTAVTEVAHFAESTGACLCTSFTDVMIPSPFASPVTRKIPSGTCGNCGHSEHSTRVHCGALR